MIESHNLYLYAATANGKVLCPSLSPHLLADPFDKISESNAKKHDKTNFNDVTKSGEFCERFCVRAQTVLFVCKWCKYTYCVHAPVLTTATATATAININ